MDKEKVIEQLDYFFGPDFLEDLLNRASTAVMNTGADKLVLEIGNPVPGRTPDRTIEFSGVACDMDILFAVGELEFCVRALEMDEVHYKPSDVAAQVVTS